MNDREVINQTLAEWNILQETYENICIRKFLGDPFKKSKKIDCLEIVFFKSCERGESYYDPNKGLVEEDHIQVLRIIETDSVFLEEMKKKAFGALYERFG